MKKILLIIVLIIPIIATSCQEQIIPCQNCNTTPISEKCFLGIDPEDVDTATVLAINSRTNINHWISEWIPMDRNNYWNNNITGYPAILKMIKYSRVTHTIPVLYLIPIEKYDYYLPGTIEQNGMRDGIIRFATDIYDSLKDYVSNAIIVYAPEMNLINGDVWKENDVNKFKNSFAAVASIFKNQTSYDQFFKMSCCWSQEWSTGVDNTLKYKDWYPGNEYVDICGVNYYYSEDNNEAARNFQEGTQFKWAIKPFHDIFTNWQYNKDIAVWEYGVSEAWLSRPGYKAQMLRNVLNPVMLANYLPRIIRLGYFEVSKNGYDYRMPQDIYESLVKFEPYFGLRR